MNMASMHDLTIALARGLATTVWLTLCGCLLALCCAFLFGIGRTSERRTIRFACLCYIEFFRGTSVFVQIFWLYYALPAFGLLLSPMLAGILALGLNVGAYGAEVVRSAIAAVGREQAEAATALNLTPRQRLRHIILPQAIPRMIPVFGNNAIELLKASAVVSMISLSDITFQAQQYRIRTGQTIVPFAATLGLYFLLYLVIMQGMGRLSRHLGAKGRRTS